MKYGIQYPTFLIIVKNLKSELRVALEKILLLDK